MALVCTLIAGLDLILAVECTPAVAVLHTLAVVVVPTLPKNTAVLKAHRVMAEV